ncbi:MAG: hypothetical protein LBP52_03130, partial [Burkholderiaceae bacterium]|nr:hypothetical protein [Burkholderiaceae bacterium]
ICNNNSKKSAGSQYIKSFHKLARALITAAMACMVWGTAPAHAAISITETDADSFRYSTVPPGWTLEGGSKLSAVWVDRPLQLTAGPNPGDDAEGQGWLRLTENAPTQRGMAVYNTAFSAADGLQITFDYAFHGNHNGKDADGMVFYLIDGSTTTPTTGASGGALGYSLMSSGVPDPGVTKGYVGIALDEFGNFSTPDAGACPDLSICKANPQSVAVRGAGNLNSGFPLLKSVSLSSLGLGKISTIQPDRSDARTVRITISPDSATLAPTVTVEIDPTGTGTNFKPVITALSLAGNGSVPDTFKMGFSASTGYHDNYHEVRIRSAKTLVSAVPALGQGTLGALAVLLALLSWPALRRRFRN